MRLDIISDVAEITQRVINVIKQIQIPERSDVLTAIGLVKELELLSGETVVFTDTFMCVDPNDKSQLYLLPLGDDAEDIGIDLGIDNVQSAIDLYSRFTELFPSQFIEMEVPEQPEQVNFIGNAKSIMYECYRADELEPQLFRHEFSENALPEYCEDDDGNPYLLNGDFRFTELGIIENDDVKHDDIY